MPVPLIAAALTAIAPVLARHGLDLLSGVFRGAVVGGGVAGAVGAGASIGGTSKVVVVVTSSGFE